MARERYYVLKDGDGWKVRHNDKDTPYDTQAEAMDAARDAAHKMHDGGTDSQVLVQGSDDGSSWAEDLKMGGCMRAAGVDPEPMHDALQRQHFLTFKVKTTSNPGATIRGDTPICPPSGQTSTKWTDRIRFFSN